MAAIGSPIVWSDLDAAGVAYAYVFAAEQIRADIADTLNVLDYGLVQQVGELSGSGSDTVRVAQMGSIGWSEAMVAAGSEVSAIAETGYTTDYTDFAIARYGLAKAMSYTSQILNRPDDITLQRIVEMVPDSFLKTLRSLMCTAGATFSASTGAVTTAWSFDNELDFIAAFHETAGFDGNLVSVRHPEQYSDLRESLRNEPAYQFPEIQSYIQGVRPSQGPGAFEFLGVRNFASTDVTASGGGHNGFAYVPGAIGWVTASTLPVKVENPDQTIQIPEYGLVCEMVSKPNTAQSQINCNAYMGCSAADSALYPQRKLISIDD